MRKILAGLLALAFATSAAAQLYKWTDQNGKIQYGDTPPPGVNATRLKPPPGAPSAPAAPATNPKDAGKGKPPLTPEAAFQKRQQERADAEKKSAQQQAEAETRRANCQAAQGQLAALQSGARLSTFNAQGERVYIDDDQRATQIAQAQKSVADWCR